MKQDIRLYIEGKEVEFSTVPQIVYSYKETDFKNPTIVKNSFSKTIEVEGTPSNNDLFGHIWQLDRYQDALSFNPSKRADFKLFVNGELYEKGYCKLDSIKKVGNIVNYSISLYGGVGSLLYRLQNGNGEGDNKLTLADLEYPYEFDNLGGSIINLDFTINKETIEQAWEQLNEEDDEYLKFDYINFAVCSEGVPEDFSADIVLFNNEGRYIDNISTDSNDYHTVLGGEVQSGSTLGYSLIETKNELTMDTSFDLRSYLLRPVVSVHKIFEALKLPQNNGGWDLQLDPHFFNVENPYYWKSWMTLPRLKDLNIEKTERDEVFGYLAKTDAHHYSVNFTKPNGVQNVRIKFNVTLNPSSTPSSSASKLFPATYLETNLTFHNTEWLVKEFTCTGGLVIRLEALDANGNVISRGEPFLALSDEWGRTALLHSMYKDGDAKLMDGHFEKVNGVWTFVDKNSNVLDFETTLSSNISYNSLRLSLVNPYREYTLYTKGWLSDRGNYDGTTDDLLPDTQYFYYSSRDTWTGEHTKAECKAHNAVQGEWTLSLIEVRPEVADYEGFFSNTFIPKDKLLKTSFTPADFLLDYCKLFGLYFYCDPTEVSMDEKYYPNGVIHIMDRDTFFREQYVDVNELIDRSKAITINPRTAESKWYSFDYNEGEGDAEKKYKDNYGYAYGRQLINTNSDFNAEVKKLYEGGIFANGVMVREKSRYFGTAPDIVGAYMYDGFDYHLFKNGDGDELDTTDLTFPSKKNAVVSINNLSLPYYDSMPKLQIHNSENGAEDGSGILLFFDHFVNTVNENGGIVYYYLTDDVGDMGLLNDGSPCWLNTTSETDGAGNTIAIRRSSLPFFTRDIYDNGEQGNIIHSWNFGHPKDTFVPRTYSTIGDGIYEKFWANYCKDFYDQNTKVVKASMFINERPNPDWLRRYYWFDNAIWRMNSLEWNVATYDASPVEFVKVQDINNYKLDEISYLGGLKIIWDDDVDVAYGGGTKTGRIVQQSSTASWYSIDGLVVGTYDDPNLGSVYGYINPTAGTGEVTYITISVPANEEPYPIHWKLIVNDDQDVPHYGYFDQVGDGSQIQPYINTNKSSIAWDWDDDDSVAVSISSNVSWTAATASAHYQIVGSSTGTNDGTITIQPTDTNHYSSQKFEATVVITGESGASSTINLVHYRQPRAYLTQGEVPVDQLGVATIDPTGATVHIEITSDYEWWFNPNPNNNLQSIKMYTDDNKTTMVNPIPYASSKANAITTGKTYTFVWEANYGNVRNEAMDLYYTRLDGTTGTNSARNYSSFQQSYVVTPNISVSPSTLVFDWWDDSATTQYFEVTVEMGGDWTYSVSHNQGDFTYVKNGRYLEVTTTKQHTTTDIGVAKRYADITFSNAADSSQTATAKAEQWRKPFVNTPSNVDKNIPATGATREVVITSDYGWWIITNFDDEDVEAQQNGASQYIFYPSASTINTMLPVSDESYDFVFSQNDTASQRPANGMGYFNIRYNDRSGNTMTDGAESTGWKQATSSSIILEDSEIYLSTTGSVAGYTLQVTSPQLWAAMSSDSWIDIETELGQTGTTNFVFNTTSNSGSNRTGHIYFIQNRVTAATLTIHQPGASDTYVTVSPAKYSTGLTAGYVQVTLNFTGRWCSWVVATCPEWIAVRDGTSPDSDYWEMTDAGSAGNNQATVYVHFDAANEAREGACYFDCGGYRAKIVIKQQ